MSKHTQDFRVVPDSLKHELVNKTVSRPIKIMEVCGTHTVAIHRFGIQKLLPPNVKLVSGPGCPVCVTPDAYIDEAVMLARKGFTITTFGDMMRVPGTISSLENERAQGHHIKMVYSPLDALDMAEKTGKDTVFLSVGFETTTPGIAVTVKEARERNITNFYLLTANRLIPPAMTILVNSGAEIDGFLLPGHVSTVLGKAGYRFLEELRVPGVIAGFEPVDMVSSIARLLDVIEQNQAVVINNYKRVVPDNGNPVSIALMQEVFEEEDAEWRGLGVMPKSGLRLNQSYKDMDIRQKVNLHIEPGQPPKGCRCGDVLRGMIDPPDCPLFGKKCKPDSPVGPCMVSTEGSCSAWYKYG